MKKQILMLMLVGLVTWLSPAAGPAQAAVTKNVVTDYGAVPDDGLNDSAAFSSALTAIVAAGGGTLFVPGGNYHFTSKITIDLKATTVVIQGDGKGVTKIHSANASGLIWFNNTSNNNQLGIFDLTFVADQASAGTAIQINNPSLSTASIVSLRMEQVGFAALTLGSHCFYRGIYTSFLQNPVLDDVFFDGLAGLTDCGFRINFGNNPSFKNCYSRSLTNGYQLTSMNGTVTLDRSFAVNVDTGFLVTAASAGSCSVTLLDCHSNVKLKGAVINNAGQVIIRNHVSYSQTWEGATLPPAPPYTLANPPPVTDFTLFNCAPVNIDGTVFHTWYVPHDRVCIDLTGTTTNVTVRNNIFNANTNAGVVASPAIAVRKAGVTVNQPGVTGVSFIQSIYNNLGVW